MNGTVRSAPRPRLWIVAGPNGSGNSSAYDRSDVDEFGGSVWIINPDLLTAKIVAVEGALPQANLAAVTRIEHWLDASIDAYQTIGVETVLSIPKYRRLVEKAKARGFEVRLIYVFVATAEIQLERIALRVATAEIQLERIALRVAKGGHDVPSPKVYARRARSFDQLGWFLEAADAAWLFDNSGAAPRLVGRKQHDVLQLTEGIPAEIMDRLTSQA